MHDVVQAYFSHYHFCMSYLDTRVILSYLICHRTINATISMLILGTGVSMKLRINREISALSFLR